MQLNRAAAVVVLLAAILEVVAAVRVHGHICSQSHTRITCSSCNAAPVGVMPKYGTLGQTGSSDTLLVMRMYGSCNLVL